MINVKNKNLIDIGKQIEDRIKYYANGDSEAITSISMNKYTKKYLEKLNIYGFKNIDNTNIPIRINEELINFEVSFNRDIVIEKAKYVAYDNK